MTAVYVDTSALGRVLLREPDAPAILDRLEEYEHRLSSELLRIELRRLALRHGLLDRADELLVNVALLGLEDEVLSAAEVVLPSDVGTFDAIHLATAIRLSDAGRAVALMTFDRTLAAAAAYHRLEVVAPA